MGASVLQGFSKYLQRQNQPLRQENDDLRLTRLRACVQPRLKRARNVTAKCVQTRTRRRKNPPPCKSAIQERVRLFQRGPLGRDEVSEDKDGDVGRR
jgi:hypothetical protein